MGGIMRLKNKKTGEIVSLQGELTYDDKVRLLTHYNSLAELNEDWEDYEEPKGYYVVTGFGSTIEFVETDLTSRLGYKEVGNYFETKEEAERVVGKLKALAEAKEDGLKIKGYYYNHEDLVILADIGKCNKLTLDELFGKEID